MLKKSSVMGAHNWDFDIDENWDENQLVTLRVWMFPKDDLDFKM